VYKKEGYWSTKYTREEQEELKQRFRANLKNPRFGRTFDRNARQYITEYKGKESDSESITDAVKALITVDTDDISDIELAEQFLTSFGLIDAPNISNIATDLADRAFIYALIA
jgi:hypothetical protein